MPPSGSATSSRRASSRREMSTLDQLSMFSHPTFAAAPGATSSPASASGTSPSGSLAGPRTGPSGPAPAPANLSPRQAAEAGLLTSGTSGRRGTTSSASADLQRSLASRLRAGMASTGSTLFTLTWTALATPSGLLICALRASARRTSGSDRGSWPTPIVNDASSTHAYGRTRADGSRPHILKLPGVAKLAHWPTPQANDSTGPNSVERQERRRTEAPKRTTGGPPGFSNLRDAAQLAAWATPAARDYRHANAQSFAERGGGKKGEQLNNQVVHLAAWTTPSATDSRRAGTITPAMSGSSLAQQAREASGLELTGSPAETAKPGQLNPAFSRWLMGLPPAWDACAPTATRSSRRSPRPS